MAMILIKVEYYTRGIPFSWFVFLHLQAEEIMKKIEKEEVSSFV